MSNDQEQNGEVPTDDASTEDQLVEGTDYYFEGPFMVFTARYLLRRGYCCDNSCRHCPYEKTVL